MVSTVQDFNKEKKLDVDSVSGTPTVDKATPIICVDGDDSTTGNGDIVIDFANISDAQDIAIYDQNDNLLDYEIEDLDTTNETAVLWCYNSWVRDGSTQAKVVYGANSDNTDNQNVTGTWDNTGQNAVMVQHLQDDPLTATDSTSNDNDGTVTGAVSATGQFDGAGKFDGADDNIDLSTGLPNFSSYSIVAWAFPETFSDEVESRILTIEQNNQIALIWDNDDRNERFTLQQGDGGLNFLTSATKSTNSWYLLSGYWDGSTIEFFVDGSSTDSASVASMNDQNSTDAIGASATDSLFFDGSIDEVRVYSDAKSSSWFQADYDASPKAGQVFFSQQAAETTVQATTDTANKTSMVMSPETSAESVTVIDTASKTSQVMTVETTQEVSSATDTATRTSMVMTVETTTETADYVDTAVKTSQVMTPETTVEVEVDIDTATKTSMVMTPETTVEFQPVTDNAVKTSMVMTPETTVEELGEVDVAVKTDMVMSPETTVETSSATDTATKTSMVMTPETSLDQVSIVDQVNKTSMVMTPETTEEFIVKIENADKTGMVMTPETSTEIEIQIGNNTLILQSFQKSIVLDQNVFKKGDTGDPYVANLRANGSQRNLDNANTVELFMRGRDGTNKVDAGSMTITNSGAGKVEYDWDSSDVDTAGIFRTEVKVTFNDGSEETFPSDDYQVIEIEEDLE